MALYAIIKKGDQNPDKRLNPDSNIFIKEGMIVSWHDEATMGPISQLSAHMKKVFVIVKVPYAYHEDLKQWVEPVYESEWHRENGVYKRERSKVINLEALAQALGDTSLYQKWGDSSIVEPVEYTGLSDLRDRADDSLLIDYNKVAAKIDTNLITSGTYTIGSGGDYADFVAFKADFGTPDGTLTGNMISSFTQTALVNFNVATSEKVNLVSNSPHGGDQTAGYVCNINHTSHGIVTGNSSGDTEVKDFTIARVVNASGTTIYNLFGNVNGGYIFHDLFIDVAGFTGSGARYNLNNVNTAIYNQIVWGASVNPANGIFLANGGAYSAVENLTVYDCYNNFNAGGITVTGENIASLACTGVCYANVASMTGNNCISSDTTIPASGTKQHTSVTVGDEVQSTDDTDGDLFMLPKTGGNMTDGGKTPAVSTQGMKGNLLHSTTPSIGAFQWPAEVLAGVAPLVDKSLVGTYLIDGSLVQ